jgi:hypothetical protein
MTEPTAESPIIAKQPEYGYFKLLQRARKWIDSRGCFQAYPLRGPHANDVPVNFALFAAKECTAAEKAARDAQREEDAGLADAVAELLEVADLRGDAELPHPCDDPKLWTARMQDAWDHLREAHAAAIRGRGSDVRLHSVGTDALDSRLL